MSTDTILRPSRCPTRALSTSEVFTSGQVATLCRVSSRIVYKWIEDGLLPGYRIAGSTHRRILRTDLVQFLKDHGMPRGDLGEDAALSQDRRDLRAALAILLDLFLDGDDEAARDRARTLLGEFGMLLEEGQS
jgi:excisionase family DNA binding protein